MACVSAVYGTYTNALFTLPWISALFLMQGDLIGGLLIKNTRLQVSLPSTTSILHSALPVLQKLSIPFSQLIQRNSIVRTEV